MATTSNARLAAAAAILAGMAAAGCADSGGEPVGGGAPGPAGAAAAGAQSGMPAPAPVDMEAFEEGFEVVREMALEENDSILVLRPMVTAGPEGELVLTEPDDGRIHVFGADGRLRDVVGRRGEGPGEFMFPAGGRLLAGGEVVASDMLLGRTTFLPLSGDADPEVVQGPLPMTMGMQQLDGDRYLAVGINPGDPRPARLHIWNRASQEIERSFFSPEAPEGSVALSMSMPLTWATVQGDTIWAGWTLSESLYKFDFEGNQLGVTPLALPRTTQSLPRDEDFRGLNPREQARELAEVTQVTDLHVLPNGDKVVSSMRIMGSAGAEQDILIIGADGRDAWRAAHLPRLLAVVGTEFYFDDPGSELPNRWIVARRRSADPRPGAPQAGLREGDTVRLADFGLAERLPEDRPTLVWSLDPASCLGCDLADPAYQVRRLHQRLGDGMATVVVAVSGGGASDEELVRSFLDSHRLAARIHVVPPQVYAKVFHGAPVHALHLVGPGGVVRASLSSSLAATWRSRPDSLPLGDFVARLTEHPAGPLQDDGALPDSL